MGTPAFKNRYEILICLKIKRLIEAVIENYLQLICRYAGGNIGIKKQLLNKLLSNDRIESSLFRKPIDIHY